MPTPGDLYEAACAYLLESAGLATSFGREGWCWRNQAPPDEPLPVAVLAHVSTEIESETFSRTSRARTELKTFQVAVYASSPEAADELCREVAETLEGAALLHEITFGTGTLIDIGRTGGESDTLDPAEAPDGSDVWGRSIELQAMILRDQSMSVEYRIITSPVGGIPHGVATAVGSLTVWNYFKDGDGVAVDVPGEVYTFLVKRPLSDWYVQAWTIFPPEEP